MTTPVEEFRVVAEAYVRWCRSEPEAAGTEGASAREAWSVLRLLLDLVHAALALEEVAVAPDIEVDRLSDSIWRATYERAAALPFQFYASQFAPAHDLEEDAASVTGDLADDLADIHRDLEEGLAAFALGHPDSAEWSWAFSFRSHWGRHATSAIHALASWLSDEHAWETP